MERIRQELMQNSNFQPEPQPQVRKRSTGKNRAGGDKSDSNTQIIYGAIPGIEPGATFPDRKHCVLAGVHCVSFAGIHGSKDTGAYSVCLSGGYEDDADKGDFFVYTGTGGQEDSFKGKGKQIKNQSFKHNMNASLSTSAKLGKPVRVIRGANPDSKWAPYEHEGYRYDGLYRVEKAYYDEGKSGFLVCKFDFRRLPNQPPIRAKYQ